MKILILSMLAGGLMAQESASFKDSKVRSVGPPNLPPQIDALGKDLVCPATGGGTVSAKGNQTKVAARQANNPQPPHTLSVDDIPPGGEDGSFRLNLGGYAKWMGPGVWATHSHPELHRLWLVDFPKKGQRGKRDVYQIRRVLMTAGSVVEIRLESGVKNRFKPAGTIRMEQTEVPGYYAQVLAKDHQLDCYQDYVWRVTSEDITLPSSGSGGFVIPSPQGSHIRIASIRVLAEGKKPIRTFNIQSGCAAFQINSRWNQPRALQPKCPSRGWETVE